MGILRVNPYLKDIQQEFSENKPPTETRLEDICNVMDYVSFKQMEVLTGLKGALEEPVKPSKKSLSLGSLSKKDLDFLQSLKDEVNKDEFRDV